MVSRHFLLFNTESSQPTTVGFDHSTYTGINVIIISVDVVVFKVALTGYKDRIYYKVKSTLRPFDTQTD